MRRCHKTFFICWLLLGVNLLWPMPQAFAQRLLLNLPPIQGSSVFHGFEHWIDIENFQWAANNPISNGRLGEVNTNTPTYSEIMLTKLQDSSSSNLFYYCAHGLVVTQATLVGAVTLPYVGKSSTFFRLELRNAFISSVNVEADTSGDPMIEHIGLDFDGKIVWSYSFFSTNGILDGTLKFENNYSSAYDKVQKVGGTLVPFQTLGHPGAGTTVIIWPAAPSAVYDILRATNPIGPFTQYLTVTNGMATNMTVNITNASSTSFFYSVQGKF